MRVLPRGSGGLNPAKAPGPLVWLPGKVLAVSYGRLKRRLLLLPGTPGQMNSLLNKMSARNG